MSERLFVRPLSTLSRSAAQLGLIDQYGLCEFTASRARALEDNPEKTSSDVPVQVLGLVDKKVVGQEIVFPLRVQAHGAVYLAFAGSGLFVHEEHRKTMLGVDLVEVRETLSENGVALGCGLSQMALPLHRMLEYVCFPMSRFVWLFKSRSVVEQRLGASFASKCLSCLIDGGLWAWRWVLKSIMAFRTRGLSLHELECATEEVVSLILRDSHPFSCIRTVEWLDWQLKGGFSGDPNGRQKLFVVKDGQQGVVGFFMYKVRFHETASHHGYKNLTLGSLMEWQSAEPNQITPATLALMAVMQMKRDGVDAVEICTDDEKMGRSLKRALLQRVGDLSFVIRASESSPLRRHTGWEQQTNWRLRPIEGDNGVS